MFDKLPDLIDPIYSAQHHKRFVARVNQGKLPRLAEHLVEANHDVVVDVQFYKHPEHKMIAFDMHLETVLNLRCQRSLEAFDYPVKSDVTGVFVESLSLADDLPNDIEVYELPEDKLSLIELIEDEVILNVPLSPIDETREMAYENPPEIQDEISEETEPKENPFAVLKSLQKDSD
ncbi:YceD family protein [Hydrogenovibrio marinus]|nr:YceD family protein [Hydrogenovibrio marinus]BBN60040.1 hypothetical protein HVMH_1634 [Hydrogenovibrio marinus]